jgi:hypothetical protein
MTTVTFKTTTPTIRPALRHFSLAVVKSLIHDDPVNSSLNTRIIQVAKSNQTIDHVTRQARQNDIVQASACHGAEMREPAALTVLRMLQDELTGSLDSRVCSIRSEFSQDYERPHRSLVLRPDVEVFGNSPVPLRLLLSQNLRNHAMFIIAALAFCTS